MKSMETEEYFHKLIYKAHFTLHRTPAYSPIPTENIEQSIFKAST